jgi:small subunit ribosomal protein S16
MTKMAVTIRLRRVGKRNMPYYRVVVVDSRKPRDGRCIDTLGTYEPIAQPAVAKVDEQKTVAWLRRGARPSATVRSILAKQGILAKLASREGAGESEELP